MMKDGYFLKGDKVSLRILELVDIEGNYSGWFNNEETCRYNSHHRFPYSKAQLEIYINESAKDKSSLVLAVVENSTGEHIGNISLQNIDYINRTAEIAFIFGEGDYRGKGYGAEAGTLIINHGFDQLNLNRIYCGTFSNNIGMQKLAAKLGMKSEGIRRQAVYKDGIYLDIFEYGLLQLEWMSIKELNDGKRG